MSRKIKAINVEGRGEVIVKEVSVLGVWTSNAKGDWLEVLKALADDAVSPSAAEIATWYPSEIEQVIDTFLEVNSSFFAVARKLKVDGLMGDLFKEISTNFQQQFAESSKAIMDLMPGIMDGNSSSTPSNS